jgi:hypothetical protein
MTRFQQAAALVAIAGLAVGIGVAVALPQSEDVATEPVATETTRTTRPRPATTVRPTTITTPPTTTATTAPSPPVVVYETPVIESSRPTCDAACTADIVDGWGTASATTVPPCKPSTYHACDPAEPMELPLFGCDVLEEDIFGDLRCIG